MKIGLILIFSNNENNIKKLRLRKTAIQICLVNNGSKDKTLVALNEIKEHFENNIEVLDVKKNKGNTAAIKAGSRYLFSKESFLAIGYMIVKSDADLQNINNLMDSATFNKDFKKLMLPKITSSTKLFPIKEYIKSLAISF